MLLVGTSRMRVMMVTFAVTYIVVCYYALLSLPDLNSSVSAGASGSGRFNPRGPHVAGGESDEGRPDAKLSELRKKLNESLADLIEMRKELKIKDDKGGLLKAIGEKLNFGGDHKQSAEVKGDELDEETKKRQNFVRKMMEHAWGGYVKHAWGQGEVRPDSQQGHNAGIFGGIASGASIVDALDTLHLMGMSEEFERGRKWVAESLDFSRLNVEVSVFEFTIRYLGGLLSAYSLSKDEMFIKKAKQLADRLLPAFNTATGIPLSLLNLQSGAGKNYMWAGGGCSILAEIGTLQMEFGYLSKLTGEEHYGQKVRKVRDLLASQSKPNGLYMNYINANNGAWCGQDTSIGALGDSFYEYLVKDWIRTGRTDGNLRETFDAAVEAIRKHLSQRSASGFFFFAERHNGVLQHRVDHLACFFAGTLALGAQHLANAETRAAWINDAAEFTRTCHESYIRTATRIGPDSFHFAGGNEFFAQRPGEKSYMLRPEVVESYFYMWRFTHNNTYRDWAWDAAQAMERHCRAKAGYSGLSDVFSASPGHDDVQQSFFLAETLKYLYLIFSPDSLLPLDQWVLNTEAHPLPVLQA